MSKFHTIGAVTMAVILTVTATPAFAQHRGGHGDWQQQSGWVDTGHCENLRSRRERRECDASLRSQPADPDIGAAIGAGLIGLTLGAIIVGAANESDKRQRLQDYDRWVAYCSSRYRSFDINSGTFLGHDGRRHPCQ